MSYAACFFTVGLGWAIADYFLGATLGDTARALWCMATALSAHKLLWSRD